MSIDQILQLQRVHSEIYKNEIEPLYLQIRTKENALRQEFNKALDKYFDSIFLDQNGKTINVGDTLQLIEFSYKAKFEENIFQGYQTEDTLMRWTNQSLEFERTGKQRTTKFICIKRGVQFLFGEMLNNPHIICAKQINGFKTNKQETFNELSCKNLVIVNRIIL